MDKLRKAFHPNNRYKDKAPLKKWAERSTVLLNQTTMVKLAEGMQHMEATLGYKKNYEVATALSRFLARTNALKRFPKEVATVRVVIDLALEYEWSAFQKTCNEDEEKFMADFADILELVMKNFKKTQEVWSMRRSLGTNLPIIAEAINGSNIGYTLFMPFLGSASADYIGKFATSVYDAKLGKDASLTTFQIAKAAAIVAKEAERLGLAKLLAGLRDVPFHMCGLNWTTAMKSINDELPTREDLGGRPKHGRRRRRLGTFRKTATRTQRCIIAGRVGRRITLF